MHIFVFILRPLVSVNYCQPLTLHQEGVIDCDTIATVCSIP
jgi:hypothetical protein